MTSITTNTAMERLFKIAQRAPLNVAPERGEELASKIFGTEEWIIAWSGEPANFFAVPEDKTIYLSAAGQASLWCLAYVAFHVMDVASGSQRAANQEERSYMDIGQHWGAFHLGEYAAFSRSLFHADRPWPPCGSSTMTLTNCRSRSNASVRALRSVLANHDSCRNSTATM